MQRLLTGLVALTVSFTAMATIHGGSHDSHSATAASNTSPASQAYAAVNQKMHRDMDIPLTGNADIDFLQGMIPHHQGAIDMAGVVLEYGKDPQVRQLAEQIIVEQQKEIALMQKLLESLSRQTAAGNQPAHSHSH